jgi:hypothetical protein
VNRPVNGVAKLPPEESIRRSIESLAELHVRLRKQLAESVALAQRTRRAPHIVAAAPNTNGRPRIS